MAAAERAVGDHDDERLFLLAEKFCRESIPARAQAALEDRDCRSWNAALDEALKFFTAPEDHLTRERITALKKDTK